LRVLSSFTPWDIDIAEEARSGTLITFEEDVKMEQAVVSGIAFNRDEAKISLIGVADKPGVAHMILGPVADANIDVDVIIQNVSHEGKTDFSFTVHRNDYARTMELIRSAVLPQTGAAGLIGDDRICKVSIVGIGMRSHVGVAEPDVPGAEPGRHQHPDDHDERDQDERRARREVHGARRCGAAPDVRSRQPPASS
jgi:aspartate kinase